MISADPEKLKAIQKWPIPTILKELRGFLGLTGYYRKFIKEYEKQARPLMDILKKQAFGWSSQATQAFGKLKAAIVNPPLLALPYFSKEFVVETDASSTGIGAVLLQEGKPLAYFSKTLSIRQQALSVYDKEMMAIVRVVEK